MEIFEEVKKLVLEYIGDDSLDVTAESTLEGDLDLDSLEIVELIITFEDKWDIFITDGVTSNFKTVGEIVAFIEKEIGHEGK